MMEKSHNRPPDLDLLERFVLERLDPQERAEVEKLVRTSGEWRKALRREQILAAGVRRLGRAGIRQRLSDRLLVSPQHANPWPRIALAAAVMCVIVGVGIMNRWFVPSPQTDTMNLDQLAETEEGAEPVQTAPDEVAGEDFAAVEKKAPPDAARRVEGGRRDKAEGRLEEENRLEAESRVAVPGHGTQEADLDDQSASTMVSGPTTVGASRTTSVFWTQGQLLTSELAALGKQVATESKEDIARDRRATADPEHGAREGQEYRIVREVSQSIALQQMPFTALDETRQQGVDQAASRLIPTLIEQRGDSLYLTLYPTSPFSDSEMQAATALPVTSDSLVVTVGSQQIGYHLPEMFLQSQHAKTKR